MKVTRKDNGNRGVATILVIGVLAVFLIFFLVVGIDFAYIYVVRGQVQNAADAAALAGAAKLSGSANPIQSDARQEAIKFAAKNTAAGDVMQLVTNNTNVLSNANDITVGFWNGTGYERGNSPYNALEARPRRTGDSPGGPVGLIFGRIVDWPTMDVSRIAVATRPPAPTSATSLCIETCTFNIPPQGTWFYFKEQQLPNDVQGLAFTRFSCEKSTPLGPDSEVARLIRGELDPPNVCDQCIVTNNGQGAIMPILAQAYEDNKDANGNWSVIVPVVAVAGPGGCPNCSDPTPGTEACPTGKQSQEPFLVEKYAVAVINGVDPSSSSPKVRFASINCTDCPAQELLGRRAKLVR